MAYRSRRYGGSPVSPGFIGSAVAAGLLVAALHGHHAGSGAKAPNHAAGKVLAYARAQLGRPYLWGGTGPDAFDCSGLAMEAYASAGITLERTSQQQWASEPHVSDPVPGDLVFFPGGDGSWSSPGHVGIVVNPATRTMIDAYATGTSIRYDTYGPNPSAPGLDAVAGFTNPGAA